MDDDPKQKWPRDYSTASWDFVRMTRKPRKIEVPGRHSGSLGNLLGVFALLGCRRQSTTSRGVLL